MHDAIVLTRQSVLERAERNSSSSQYRGAYQRALPLALTLPVRELITINIDVPTAVTLVIGKLPKIQTLRAAIAIALPTFELVHVDELETYALATAHAHARYLAAAAAPQHFAPLVAQTTALRDMLHSDAVALDHRGLLNGRPLADFRRTSGYTNVAFELLGLTALLRRAWPEIAHKTALTLEELEEAERLGELLLGAVGSRAQRSRVVEEVIQLRQRMFTLLTQTWNQVRRAVSYLRWSERDVNVIVPSLYAGRARRKRTSTRSTHGTPPGATLTAAPQPASWPDLGVGHSRLETEANAASTAAPLRG